MAEPPAALEIRAARRADAPGLWRILPPRAGDPEPATAFLLAGSDDEGSALVAVDGEEIAGALRGAISDAGYCIHEIHARPGALVRVTGAFLRAVRARFPGQSIEARIQGERPDEALHLELLRAGASLALDQRVFERDLRDFESAEADPFTYRPYAETGKAAMADTLARIFAGEGGSGCLTSDPWRELDRMIHDGAGEDGGLDAGLWRTATLDGEPIGVALARLDRDPSRTGTLAYFGLLPGARGRGLGRALHAATLRLLAAAGAERYEDATGVGNAAMQRVFERSGCRPCGSTRQYVVHAPVEAGHLADFEGLAAYLTSEGHRVKIVTPGVWARVPMRFGPHAAALEVGWLRDARLVQVLHTYPEAVPRGRLEQAARAAGALNAASNVPGFILDEEARRVSFRLPLCLDERGGVSVYLLRRSLALVVAAVATHRGWWREVILGGPDLRPPTSLLERIPVRRSR